MKSNLRKEKGPLISTKENKSDKPRRCLAPNVHTRLLDIIGDLLDKS